MAPFLTHERTMILAGVLVVLAFGVGFHYLPRTGGIVSDLSCPSCPSIPSVQCLCPAAPLPPPEKICPQPKCDEVIASTVACPTVTCPPEKDCPTLAIPADIKDKALNLKPTESVPAVQDGFFKCKALMLDLFHLKPLSPFWEGNPRMNYGEFSRNLIERNSVANGSVCFSIQDGSDYGMRGIFNSRGIFLNHSIWNVTPVNQTWERSNLSLWTDNDNLTWIKNDTWWESNYSADLWLVRHT